jgi:hypothetical protein
MGTFREARQPTSRSALGSEQRGAMTVRNQVPLTRRLASVSFKRPVRSAPILS